MAEENEGQEGAGPSAEAPQGACISLSAASPLSVADAATLSQEQRNLILAAASKIAEADRIAADKVASDKLAAEQHEQSRAGRRERQEKAGAAA